MKSVARALGLTLGLALAFALLTLPGCAKRSKESAEQTAGSASAAPTAPTPATHPPAPTAPPAPERFTLEQIAKVIGVMKQCVDRVNQTGDARELAVCACRADLQLSKTFKAPDPVAHCAAFADRFAAATLRSDEAQMQAPFELAAPDVFPGSFLTFTLATPCLIQAAQQKSLESANACFCRAHAFANRMAARGLQSGTSTGRDVMQATSEIAEELMHSNACPSPAPTAQPTK